MYSDIFSHLKYLKVSVSNCMPEISIYIQIQFSSKYLCLYLIIEKLVSITTLNAAMSLVRPPMIQYSRRDRLSINARFANE